MSLTFLKRVNKELENFVEQKGFDKYSNPIIKYFTALTPEVYIVTTDNIDEYYLRIDQNDKLLLEFIIPRNYPFKPYSIVNFLELNNNSINYKDITYNKYTNNLQEKCRKCNIDILRFFYKILYLQEPKFLNLNKNECYCCASITCLANWSPGLSLPNILLEFLEIKFIEKYSQPDDYKELEDIYNYLHKEYFNKLPIEIYELIIEQI